VGFHAGQPVRVSIEDSSLLVSPIGEVELSLAQKLAMFDPQQHGGEAMISGRTGREVV
jgi:antitoxin MazE